MELNFLNAKYAKREENLRMELITVKNVTIAGILNVLNFKVKEFERSLNCLNHFLRNTI